MAAGGEAAAKQLKSDDWKTIVSDLRVSGGRACFRGRSLASSKGPVTVPEDVPDATAIH